MSVLDNALQTLFKLGIEVKKRWENASPASAFPGQTVNADMDGDFSLIEFRLQGNANQSFWEICEIDKTGIACAIRGTDLDNPQAGNLGAQTRRYTPTATGVTFSGSTYMFASSYSGNNEGCIPTTICTIKLLGGGQ